MNVFFWKEDFEGFMDVKIVAMVVIWLFILMWRAFQPKKQPPEKKTGASLIIRLKSLPAMTKVSLSFVLLLDVVFFVSPLFRGYFLYPHGGTILFILNLTAFYVFARGISLARYWKVIVFTLAISAFMLHILLHLILEEKYETLSSPSGQETIIIAYRHASLGETNHFYDFYKKTAFPGMVKKLNQQTVHIITRGDYSGDLEVLGIQDMTWVDGDYILFESPYTRTKISLK